MLNPSGVRLGLTAGAGYLPLTPLTAITLVDYFFVVLWSDIR